MSQNCRPFWQYWEPTCFWTSPKTEVRFAAAKQPTVVQKIGGKFLGNIAKWSLSDNVTNSAVLDSRTRWIGPSEPKTPKIKTGHTYSYVKLNFRVDLFSCMVLFEAIFCCFFGILYLPYFTRKNGQNKPENQPNWNMAKIAPKSDKFMK